MEFTVGAVLEGKVKSITKFGAFISLPDGKSGLVHISEIAYRYVSEVREVLTEGQEVKVQIIAIDPNGKISLSIKRALPRPQPVKRTAPATAASVKAEPASFEDKLKAFLSESDSKIALSHQYERKTRSRKR